MGIRKIPNIHPESADMVKVKTAGNITEIQFTKATMGTPIQKIDKDHGIDKRTGELIEYQHNTSRAGDKASVAQSLRKLRDIINANLTDPAAALWVTLTYKENMREPERLYIRLPTLSTGKSVSCISSYPLDGDTPSTFATVSALRNSGSSS